MCTRFPLNWTTKVKFHSRFPSRIEVDVKVCPCRFSWPIMQVFSPIRKRVRLYLKPAVRDRNRNIFWGSLYVEMHMISGDSYFVKVKLWPVLLSVSTLSKSSHIVVCLFLLYFWALWKILLLQMLLCTSGRSRSILPASRLQLHLNHLCGSPLQVTVGWSGVNFVILCNCMFFTCLCL